MAPANTLHAHRDQFRQSFSPVGFQDQSCGTNASSFTMRKGHKNSALNKQQHKNTAQCAEKAFEPFDGSTEFWHKLCVSV
jgi:hypothetical protein